MQNRKWFSIFSCGCNQYKSIHLIGYKDTVFSLFHNLYHKKITQDTKVSGYFLYKYLRFYFPLAKSNRDFPFEFSGSNSNTFSAYNFTLALSSAFFVLSYCK